MIIQLLSESALLVILYMTAWYIAAQIKKDNSIVDIAWGIGFVLIAWFTFFRPPIMAARHILITTLITIWGLRISLHIFTKNKGKSEDIRYADMKKKWGRYVPLYSFIIVFMVQAFFMLIIGYPIIVINASEHGGLTILDFIGLFVWIIGFACETIADYQLLQFTSNKNNAGKVMTQGLWKFSRHPNYFGEALIWWGIWLIALSVPHGESAIISPLTITYLLLYISGVPMAERYMGNLEGFEDYKKRTSAFIPWFPKDQ